MKKMVFKKSLFIIMILLAFFGGSLYVLTPINYVNAQCVPGDADGDGDPCDHDSGENIFNCRADCLPPGIPDKSIPDVIDDAVSWLLTIAIALSILVMIYGGTYYVFSSGDMQKVENAKKIVKYAFLGLIVAGISFAVIKIADQIFH